MSFAEIPAGDYRLADIRVPGVLLEGALPGPADEDGIVRCQLLVRDGRVAAIEPLGAPPGDLPVVGLDGGQVWPCLVDLHTHLDKGHTWPRQRNPDGSFFGAVTAVHADRTVHWSAEDVERRMDFSLRTAEAHGTVAVRTHIDSYPGQAATSWEVFRRVRDRWQGRITLQAASILPVDNFATPFGREVADIVAESGGALGAVTRLTGGLHDAVPAEVAAQIETVFRYAAERGLDLDFHVDESLEPGAHALRLIADLTLRLGFSGKVTCGHCCALSVQPDEVVEATLERVREAGIAIVSLPMCNLYLQDRQPGRTPRRRGVTLLHEMAARGIPVAVASDNTRDPFYAWGDLDMVEVFRMAVRIAHLDHPFGAWPAAVARTPAEVMGLPERGRIGPGLPADLVLFRARHMSELLSRPQADRIVLRAGRPLGLAPPDYRELDGLFGSERA